jgi:hypothetical protein
VGLLTAPAVLQSTRGCSISRGVPALLRPALPRINFGYDPKGWRTQTAP